MCTVTNRAFGCRDWTMHAPMRPGWPPGAHLFHRLVHRLDESVRDWAIQQHRIFLTDAVSCCAAKKIERRRPAPTDRAARSPHASSSNLRCVWMSVWASLARIWRARLTLARLKTCNEYLFGLLYLLSPAHKKTLFGCSYWNGEIIKKIF